MDGDQSINQAEQAVSNLVWAQDSLVRGPYGERLHL
jgi:hypothetical protein